MGFHMTELGGFGPFRPRLSGIARRSRSGLAGAHPADVSEV